MDAVRSNPLPPRAPGPLRRGLDTLRVKLFLAIAGAHLVLVAATYLIYSWSFDEGLVEYVNQSDRARLTPVIAQLADGYASNGNWEWVTKDRDQWFGLLREVLGWRVGPRPGGPRNDDRRRDARNGDGEDHTHEEARAHPEDFRHLPEGGRVPRPFDDSGPVPPLTIDWRMVLFDASGTAILNPSGDPNDAEAASADKLEIRVNSQVVGFLGYVPRLRVLQSIESITARQQSQRFTVLGIGMLAAVFLNAALISSWLARRLRALGAGATALARGDYATRIPARGHDELARLAGDFNHLAEALEAAQRGRQQWIADIAHELRTPLTTLRAELEAVQDGVRPLTQDSISSVAQEVQRLTRLVEDLRLLSLSDLGALTYRKEPVELAEIITDQLAAGAAAIDDGGLDVKLELDQRVVVEADADRLAQVFINLLQNTLRYSEPPALLRVRVSADGKEARIDWEDSSPGVSDADLGRLTDRLYRVDSSRASSSGGSGLGLAIVHAIVTGHGGRMQPEHSALGGLHWRIWLPLAESRVA